MRKTVVGMAILAVAITGLVALTPAPGEAWGRVFIGVGPYWGWGYPGPYYGYPYPYSHPPVTVVEQPRVYIQQPAPETQPPAVSEAPPAPESAYWYYCPSSRDYYPNVPSCSEAWVRVPARTQ